MVSIGIDLGTTNSLVSIYENGEPRILTNELDEMMTPSVVAQVTGEAVLVGRMAKDHLVNNPSNGVACFKRDMGSTKTYQFAGRSWSPVELSAIILKELKRIAEMRLGTSVERAVISVPAYFHDAPRQATIDAAEIAGLKVDRLINEPTAAALAYGCQNKDADTKLMVFDIGGGTFDVTLLEVFDQIIDVRASGGISRLGGEDYLDRLIEHVIEKLDLIKSKELMAKLKPQLEYVKRQLSDNESVDYTWDEKELIITQNDFSNMCEDLTNRLRPIIIRCLRDAGMSLKELENIVLVGGASRMNIVKDLVNGLSNKNVLDDIDPDLVVAQGASIQAALANDDSAIKDVALTDVAPHSLGISISREVRTQQYEDGIFSPIIDRNSTLPISRSNVYQTLSPMVDEIDLVIYQGEHRFVRDNHMLGKLTIKGLRGKPDQEMSGQCDVRFTYDMNGILEVDATVLHNNKKFNAVIEERPGQMTKKQIEEAINRLKPLKVNLRDLLPNRARIERGLRLYEELNGAFREHLEQLLGQFEVALESQDKEAVSWTGAALDQYIDGFYGHEQERSNIEENKIDGEEGAIKGPQLVDKPDPQDTNDTTEPS